MLVLYVVYALNKVTYGLSLFCVHGLSRFLPRSLSGPTAGPADPAHDEGLADPHDQVRELQASATNQGNQDGDLPAAWRSPNAPVA